MRANGWCMHFEYIWKDSESSLVPLSSCNPFSSEISFKVRAQPRRYRAASPAPQGSALDACKNAMNSAIFGGDLS